MNGAWWRLLFFRYDTDIKNKNLKSQCHTKRTSTRRCAFGIMTQGITKRRTRGCMAAPAPTQKMIKICPEFFYMVRYDTDIKNKNLKSQCHTKRTSTRRCAFGIMTQGITKRRTRGCMAAPAPTQKMIKICPEFFYMVQAELEDVKDRWCFRDCRQENDWIESRPV